MEDFDLSGITARVETDASKPYFRKAWKAGCCLIPADGWYKWLGTAKSKQPYFIHRSDDQPILMAGLYETNIHATSRAFPSSPQKQMVPWVMCIIENRWCYPQKPESNGSGGTWQRMKLLHWLKTR